MNYLNCRKLIQIIEQHKT